MRLLANENFSAPAVDALRAAGHDVLWARTDLAGQPDSLILQRAQQDPIPRRPLSGRRGTEC